jgi:hypothetical protein
LNAADEHANVGTTVTTTCHPLCESKGKNQANVDPFLNRIIGCF